MVELEAVATLLAGPSLPKSDYLLARPQRFVSKLCPIADIPVAEASARIVSKADFGAPLVGEKARPKAPDDRKEPEVLIAA